MVVSVVDVVVSVVVVAGGVESVDEVSVVVVEGVVVSVVVVVVGGVVVHPIPEPERSESSSARVIHVLPFASETQRLLMFAF